jgi:hypothetical protein
LKRQGFASSNPKALLEEHIKFIFGFTDAGGWYCVPAGLIQPAN